MRLLKDLIQFGLEEDQVRYFVSEIPDEVTLRDINKIKTNISQCSGRKGKKKKKR